MEKIKNLSLRKTIVLYMIISLIISFYLSALIMRIATTVQNNIWWKYVDQEEYFEMAEGDGRRYLPDVPRPHSYEMKEFDYHVSEYVISSDIYSAYRICCREYYSGILFY